jgi:fluoroacetyl-CoA thioesterase
MKPSLQPGVSLLKRIVVDRDRTISFMGEDARVYSTPWMVRDIERACRDLILEHAEEGEDSVGIDVAIKHLGATLPDMNLEIAVRVTSVEGRKVTFEVGAKDDLETVGAGTHARFVVDVAKTVERLKAKAARWRAAT